MSLRIATLAIGDELLDGRLADTNSKSLADALSALGLRLTEARIADDTVERIAAAVRDLAQSVDVIVTSGGLGPTTDDLTAEGVAAAAGCGIRLDEPTLEGIRKDFKERGFDLPDNNKKQAEVPETARIVDNDVGVAPGFVTQVGAAEVWSFPGVPREYRWLVEHGLLPALAERVSADRPAAVARRTIRCLGVTESGLGDILEQLEPGADDLLVQYRTSFPENHARLVVTGTDRAAVEARADALAEKARARIGGGVYAIGEQGLAALLVAALTARGETLAVAESCTGGLLGAQITEVSGASAVFAGGIISYSNDVKERLLDVKHATLEAHGAVSEECAAEMAAGARAALGTTWGLSITGVAGPSGGTADKPVGTVCFGLAGPDGAEAKRRFIPFPARDAIRAMSAAVSMRWLHKTIAEGPGRAPSDVGA